MPDGTTQHYRSAAVGGSMPATHRLGVSSVEEDGEVGLNLIFDARKVKSGDTTPVAPDISDGATLWVRRGDGKVFIGKSGQIVFRALSEVSGSSMSGTFDGIASEGLSSKEDPSADAIKVTNGVFYATVP